MLRRKDILVLGMMIFALFLGAGNIIFPPMEGFQAGQHWPVAATGFILTGVLMPFITLVCVATLGRGEMLTRDLPRWAEIAFLGILYLVIGSTFAMPRVTNVAYEMAWLPLNVTTDDETGRFTFSLIFNLIAMLFMLRPNTIISSVGKFMTPALLALLVVVSISVINSPLSPIQMPTQAYAEQPALTVGLLGGYQTMDVLAAIAFGGIVSRALAVKGISQGNVVMKYTLSAGAVSVVMLAALYFSLFYIGATAADVAQTAKNGGQIFSRYVAELFGQRGTWMMAGIIILANLTTLVGVTSAAADYFAKFHPRLGYPFWVIIFTLMTTAISQYGLTTLLRVTIPALLLVYPLAIMLVALQLIRRQLPSIKLSYYATLLTTLCFSLCDSLRNLGWLPESINQTLSALPLYDLGLPWLLPALAMMLLSMLIGRLAKQQ